MSKEPHIHQLIQLDNGMGMAIGPCYKTGLEYSTKAFSLIGYMSWILKEDNIPLDIVLKIIQKTQKKWFKSALNLNFHQNQK